MNKLPILAAGVFLSGCAAIPSQVLLEQGHESSAAQHICRAPTDYGINSTSVVLNWNIGDRAYLALGEGVSYNASMVPHHPEIFTGRFGIVLWSKGP